MKDFKLNIEYLPIKALKPYEKNARKHNKEDVSVIMKSIEKYGFSDPIGIWSDKNIIVEGHGRVEACKKLGIKEVPVIRLDHLTDEERRQYALMHNKSAELSSWDFDILGEELQDLDFGDLELDWGLPNEDIDWAGVEDLSEKTYDEPTHKMLECPACNHIDRDIHFKKVEG